MTVDGIRDIIGTNIVMLRLHKEPEPSDAVVPICLRREPLPPAARMSKCYVAGWSRGKLEFVRVTVTPCGNDVCVQFPGGPLPCMVRYSFWEEKFVTSR
jgi:hypothetical protein